MGQIWKVPSLGGQNMMTLTDAIKDARKRQIVIGHFNVSDLVALKAVTSAARELKLPVLVGVSEGERNFLGVREIAAVVANLRERLSHPIFLNADHTHSLEGAVEAAAAGFDMICFDASTMPLETNIDQTSTRNHSWVIRRFLNRRWWTFFLVQAKGVAVSL